jgi:ubiquinol-cytochrome c reductase cytochrome c subunit
MRIVPITAPLSLALALAVLFSANAAKPAGKSASTAMGDATAGKKIFTANCSTCHGATGAEGGVGPSLKNETKRKNYAQIVAWIKNPKPPMPKLYPSPLSAKDVNNVAAYVATIK